MNWGITVPLPELLLPEHQPVLGELEQWGYTDLWTAEVNGTDGFTPLALASAWTSSARLGTAIVSSFTRGPALLAMTAASLAQAAPGRFALGLGASSPAIVQSWNAMAFDEPFKRTRDMLRFLRVALSGQKVDADYATFSVRGFRLETPVPSPPPILLAALREGMLRLAGQEADGVILNWLAADNVGQCLAAVNRPGIEAVARIFVCPTQDAQFARAAGRRMIAAYLTVPAYSAFHDWLGNTEIMTPMRQAWHSGDRRGALAAIPDAVVDALVPHGSPEQCREQVQAYAQAGVTTPVIAVVPGPDGEYAGGLREVLRRMAPED